MTDQNLFSRIAGITLALEQSEDKDALYRERAEIFIGMGLTQDALKDLMSLANPDAHDLIRRGQLRLKLNDKKGAFSDLQEAAHLDPTLFDSLSGDFHSENQ